MRTLFLILALSAPTSLAALPVFDTLDTNKDGELSITEFQAERTKRFNLLDANKDLTITREELEGQGVKFGLTLEQTQAFLSFYDLNYDGDITLDEMNTADDSTNIFTNLDFNQDGAISREEATGTFDTRPMQDISPKEILQNLRQGVVTRGAFKPLPRTDRSTPAQPLSPRPTQDRQALPYDSQGLVDIDSLVPHMNRAPTDRSGYTARPQNTGPTNLRHFDWSQQPPG